MITLHLREYENRLVKNNLRRLCLYNEYVYMWISPNKVMGFNLNWAPGDLEVEIISL
jgi:hypothetical protein